MLVNIENIRCYVCHNTLFFYKNNQSHTSVLFGIDYGMENFNLNNLKGKTVHFVGIGGISMSALALMLKQNKIKVQGSDDAQNSEVEKLRKKGVVVFVGHDSKNVQGADVVVYSSAISKDNPELVFARQNKLLIIKRAELLGMVAKGYKYVISIAGSHGKTTASAMIAEMMHKAGLKPTVHIGGVSNMFNSNYKIGNKRYFVTESCEYKDNYLHINPDVSIVLNIDADHLDYFKTLQGVKDSFFRFAQNTKSGGINVICADDENSGQLSALDNAVLFGFSKGSHLQAKNIKEYKPCHYSFDAYFAGCKLGNIKLNVLGRHNVYNALACLIVALAFDIEFNIAKDAIESFAGVKRRCQKIVEKDGVVVYHDYAHHPKQIDEMIDVGKQLCKKDKGRVVVVFEPHTYSRTKFLLKGFVESLCKADKIFIAPVYSAREPATAGYDSLKLANEIKKYNKSVEYLESYKEIFEGIKSFAKKGDVVMILGAGTIFKLGDMFLK